MGLDGWMDGRLPMLSLLFLRHYYAPPNFPQYVNHSPPPPRYCFYPQAHNYPQEAWDCKAPAKTGHGDNNNSELSLRAGYYEKAGDHLNLARLLLSSKPEMQVCTACMRGKLAEHLLLKT